MTILNTLLRAVTWWDSQTIGTQLFTWRKGVRVGTDTLGNICLLYTSPSPRDY